MVGMAPVAAVPHMYSPIRFLTPVATELERVLSMAGQYEFAARDSLFSDISETLCHKVTDSVRRNESACAVPENIIFAVAGFDAPQMNFRAPRPGLFFTLRRVFNLAGFESLTL